MSQNLTRRGALAAAGAVATATAASSPLAALAGTETALKDLAAAKGLRFGNAIGIGAFKDPKLKALMIAECNVLVMENELKMYVTHNNNATDYNFAPADELLGFAEANKIPMRGHNLYWARDEFTPQWLKAYDFGAKPKVEAERLLRDYIKVVTTRYGDRICSWDVVNETIDPATGEVRDNVFTRILGMDVLRIAFEAARENLPKTELVYNDYMSWEAGNEKHRAGVLKMLRWFRDKNIPIDALGVQSHIGNGFDLLGGQVNQWKDWLDAIVAMDYDLHITEFDVDDQRIPTGDIEQRDAIVATVGRIYLDQMLSYKQTKDVIFWGMPDHYNWLQGFTPREDKLPLRPTPFDSNYEKKPLYYAIAESFKNASPR
ncbi:endo-1,4-beta-xylanase [Asticcacaulis biprosthecium]|uniref:endo-1,4-beta-xylanase n=1 Tax=Asticcacaulis biprosthecium TaxID=76891 RepID=UPI0002D5E47F|nr:endo-1,4-beta-xylanase [Asticcacaulis biprosthecium]